MEQFNFSNEYYKNIALNTKSNDMNVHGYVDAFFLLINGMDYESLSFLCDRIYDTYNSMYGEGLITKEQCYFFTQNMNLDKELKQFVYDIAETCLKEGLFLGTKMCGKFNTSAWLCHTYYVGECCASLANIIGINPDKARTYGLLHDYGRSKEHSFNHTLQGYEDLVTLGWKDEAIACLTHSFVNGGRCSNNEKAVPGFYVDDDGNPRWKVGTVKDDMTLFLENYQYNEYDKILNIADLMAVNKGIVSPYDRIQDIATRRELDPVNRGYFLADITNVFIDFLKNIGYIDKNISYIKATKDMTLSEIEANFKEISQLFYETYLELDKKNNKKIIED